MPEIQAFRGLRYNLARVGALSDCIAPPYDVVDAGLYNQLCAKSPYNFIRLELPQLVVDESAAESDVQTSYAKAAKLFRAWLGDGVFQHEPDPAIYVYHQEFTVGGESYTRRGFIACVKLERFGQGKIYPHEETHAKAKEDRLKVLRATEANLSPIFGLYSDPYNRVQVLLDGQIAGVQGVVAVDHLGVTHRLWPITDVSVIQQVTALVSEEEMFVADGHHRYETACNYRDELEAKGELYPGHPANFVMTTLVGMDDPGLVVLPTHRLIPGSPEFTAEELVAKLTPFFDCEIVADGPESAGAVWAEIERLDEQWIMALYAVGSQQWVRISARQEAADRMAEVAAAYSQEWQNLGVSLLHELVLNDLLGLKDLPALTYVHSVQEVIYGLQGKLDGNQKYSLAALIMPASLDHIQEVSLQGERMPAKSTYFYPKLISGLTVHPLS